MLGKHRKRLVGRPGHTYEDNIKIVLREMGVKM
jgi:hypothetical protein